MEKYQEESIEFIKNELIPEAVHNRCFCEPGSREFVEFDSVVVEPLNSSKINYDATEYYKARLIVNFSGEPNNFALIIKLLHLSDGENRTYDRFLNEEMFYSKITKKYDLEVYPKCYIADMGRYGRPVIVLEDLEACGYVRVDSKLDEDHLELCLKAIARFHTRGLKLKAENFNSFREFYAKLIDTRLDTESSEISSEVSNRILDVLKKQRNEYLTEMKIGEDENLTTICHGNLVHPKSFFFKYENKKPVDVKVIGWNRMRYCSIAVDLNCILSDQVSNDNDVRKYLTLYFDGINK